MLPKMRKRYLITGIGTDIGKTVVSAILSELFEATYWKPVQAGDLDNSDTMKVQQWCTEKVRIYPESYRLQTPLSPHASAALEGVEIGWENLSLPALEGNMIIEGAGGLMVPLNAEGLLLLDLIETWGLPVILVSRHYLGSINHTLLSAYVLQSKKIKVAGIIFVGDENKESEQIILQQTKLNYLARIPIAGEITSSFVQEQALCLSRALHLFE
jgi:dethiobiotin synthetase